MRKLFIILLLFPLFSFGQVNLDSLWSVWNNENQADTARLKAMRKIAWYGYLFTQPDSAFYFAQLEYDFAKSKGLKKQMASALNIQGVSFSIQGDYAGAIDYYTRCLSILEEMEDKQGIATSLNNMGIIYQDQGDYTGAIDYYTRSLTIMEEIGDKKGIAASLNNIGNIYYDQGDSTYSAGNAALSADKYTGAIDYYIRSLAIREEMGDKRGIANSLTNIGAIYYKQGDYTSAIAYGARALNIAQEVGAATETRSAANALYKAYEATGRHKPALEMYELYITTRDSIASEENQKEVIRQAFKYDYEKKEAVADTEHQAELDKQEALATEEQKKQNVIIGSVSGGLGLVVLFSIFLFNRFQVTRRQKSIIEEQKEEVDRAYGSLEEKNKEITDSINYAQRIQEAILPPDRIMNQYLSNSFVLYKPKDIVAGDFYWMEPGGENIIFAAADCTGHGVPGAMLSMLCNNALNRSVREYGLTDPGKILDKTREIIIEEFEKSDEHVKDGMDISLCVLNGNKLQFAGAYNLLWIIRNGEVIEIKGDRQPIGNSDDPLPFTTHLFDLEKGDIFYIFSDGYVDQFGGEKGKKLKAKAFRNLLLSVIDKPMDKQKVLIDEAFEKWRGKLEQIDDVCVIGVKID